MSGKPVSEQVSATRHSRSTLTVQLHPGGHEGRRHAESMIRFCLCTTATANPHACTPELPRAVAALAQTLARSQIVAAVQARDASTPPRMHVHAGSRCSPPPFQRAQVLEIDKNASKGKGSKKQHHVAWAVQRDGGRCGPHLGLWAPHR